MFTPDDFRHLAFLEGRWVGAAPDGKAFHEAYAFAGETTLVSTRYADATYADATDSSRVELTDGVVTSTWGDFTWRAVELAPGRACFEPVAAPSAFCWERDGDDGVRVTQRWTDDAGKAQEYSVALRRP